MFHRFATSRGLKPAAQEESEQLHGELATVELDHAFGYDDGMICGGQMDVAMTVLASPADLSPYR